MFSTFLYAKSKVGGGNHEGGGNVSVYGRQSRRRSLDINIYKERSRPAVAVKNY